MVRGAELHNGPNPECRGSGAGPQEQSAQPNIPDTLAVGLKRARSLHFISRSRGHNRLKTGPGTAEVPHCAQVSGIKFAEQDTRSARRVKFTHLPKLYSGAPNQDRYRTQSLIGLHARNEIQAGQNRQAEWNNYDVWKFRFGEVLQNVKSD